jgi:FtsZ-interacting cell division protein ZipA
MNDLQISLLIVGAVAVLAIVAFNRWQERKLKRRAETLFKADCDDVLLGDEAAPEAPPAPEGRVEPTFGTDFAAPEDEVPGEGATPRAADAREGAPAAPSRQAGEDAAPELADYIARLHADHAVAAAEVLAATRSAGNFGKPVFHFGLDVRGGAWKKLADADGDYQEFAVALQLVDRAGAVAAQELELFCDAVQGAAADLGMTADCPPIQAALDRARQLDALCAEADMLVGINVIPANGAAIPATKLRALAEAAGMKLAGDGAFYARNDDGTVRFSLCNLDPVPFSPENIKSLSSHGVTLLLDVPKTANGARVFDEMAVLARQMANALGGEMVDDNRRPLTDAGMEGIRKQLAVIYRRMEEMRVPAGGELALRLFS